LVSTLIADPHRYAIVIIDSEYRFDVTRLVSPSSHVDESENVNDKSLPATLADLGHVYVYRPARSSLRPRSGALSDEPPQDQTQISIAAAEHHMLYGAHASRGRAWWGTVVIGGSGGDVNAGWKGWMDVQRREIAPFGVGVSAEEALAERDRRNEFVQQRGWEGRSRVGVYPWGERGR
jgi:hypothetical protein